jgi:hypothetical protein
MLIGAAFNTAVDKVWPDVSQIDQKGVG